MLSAKRSRAMARTAHWRLLRVGGWRFRRPRHRRNSGSLRALVHVPRLPPAFTGGAEHSMLTTAELLAAAGLEIAVLTPSQHEMPGVSWSAREHYETGGVPKELYRWADVVLTQQEFGYRALRLGAAAGTPVVYFGRAPRKPTPFGRVDGMVFNCQWLEEVEGNFIDCPSLVFQPPVVPDRYRTEIVDDCISVGSFSEVKGRATVLAIAEAMPHRRFLAVRAGWGNQESDGPVPDNLEIMETRSDIRALYRRTRILLAPSHQEAYGRVAIEAACSAIPTIAHPTPGLVEALGSAGIFVHYAATDAWVEAIEQLDDEAVYSARSAAVAERARLLNPKSRVSSLVHFLDQVVEA